MSDINQSNSSSDERFDGSFTDDDDDLTENLACLKPYSFEPIIDNSSSSDTSSSEEELDVTTKKRIGNTLWCTCGFCRVMETNTESLCCKEKNEIPQEKFEGKN